VITVPISVLVMQLSRLRVEVDLDDVTVRVSEEVVGEGLRDERMHDGDEIVLHALAEVAARIDGFREEAEVEPRRQAVRAAPFEEELKTVRRSQDGRCMLVATGKYCIETEPEVRLVKGLAHSVIARRKVEVSHFRGHDASYRPPYGERHQGSGSRLPTDHQ
jgi:hypothetical protein